MPRNLHLHIGLPKCASTTLQKLLFDNRGRLGALGYHYPLILKRPLGNAGILVQHATKERYGSRLMELRHPGILDFNDRAQFFRENYLSTDQENVIVSGEGLCRAVQEYDFNFLFEEFENIQVYMVLRPKVLWAESHYCQNLKTGQYRAEFVDELGRLPLQKKLAAVMNYTRHLKFWQRKVGKQNLHLLFLGEQFPPIEELFLNALLSSVPADFVVPKKLNESAAIETLAACAQQEWDTDRLAYSKRLQLIAREGRKIGLTRKPRILDRQSFAMLQKMFNDDDIAFAKAQSVCTIGDLQPDIANRLDKADTLEAARTTTDFARLRDHLKNLDIML